MLLTLLFLLSLLLKSFGRILNPNGRWRNFRRFPRPPMYKRLVFILSLFIISLIHSIVIYSLTNTFTKCLYRYPEIHPEDDTRKEPEDFIESLFVFSFRIFFITVQNINSSHSGNFIFGMTGWYTYLLVALFVKLKIVIRFRQDFDRQYFHNCIKLTWYKYFVK